MRHSATAAVILSLALALTGVAQERVDLAMVARIKEEGLQRSRARVLYLTLSDSIGARLTASPSYTQAARWARDRFAEWKLSNPRLEPWMFGRGWSLEKISVEMTVPRYMPLIAYADAWTPSIPRVLSGRAVYVGDKTAAEIQAMAGQLRGAIVLTRLPQAAFMEGDRPQPGLSDQPIRTGNPVIPAVESAAPAGELLSLLQRAGAAVALKPSAYRDGTVGVVGNRTTRPDAVPFIAIAAEQYNMLARLAATGTPVELRIELRTRYYEDNLNTYNVLAEIPGTDPKLRDEVVLVGAHLDSWHTGNGATDNGDGVVSVMEAMRILTAIGARLYRAAFLDARRA